MSLELLLTRRSIRRFTPEPVTETELEDVLRAAMHAPSAGNQQPWHFVMIRNRETLNTIADIHPHAQMLREAPAAILICGEESLEKHKGYWVQDCSAATQNALLALHSKGLGGVWLGIYPRQDRMKAIAELLQIPDSITPFSAVALGHPAEQPAAADRFRKDRVHLDRW